jgi:hypothetical protein
MHADEKRGGCERAAGLVVHQHREGDLADPIAELVDRVSARQLGESR